jgi:hypothetical protein
MSPSGSRIHNGGTSTTGKPFWQRALRRRAVGAKTDGKDGFLFLRIGGMAVLRGRSFEYNTIVIGKNFDDL